MTTNYEYKAQQKWLKVGLKLEICACKQTLVHILILVLIWNFTFFDLWPLNRRSDKEVTVDTFACLPKVNMLTPLVLPFNVVWNLTLFDLWPLNRRSDKEVTVKTFACLSKGNMLAPLILPFDVFLKFDLCIWLCDPKWPWIFFSCTICIERL